MSEDMQLGHGWQLDKRISIGHLLTTVTVIVTVVIWAGKIEGRIETNNVRITASEKAITELRTNNATQYAEIIRRLERLDANNQKHLEQHAQGGAP